MSFVTEYFQNFWSKVSFRLGHRRTVLRQSDYEKRCNQIAQSTYKEFNVKDNSHDILGEGDGSIGEITFHNFDKSRPELRID